MSEIPNVIEQIIKNSRPLSEVSANPTRPFIPADVDLSIPQPQVKTGVLDGATMRLPEVAKPAPSRAEVLLATPMHAPVMSAEPPPRGYIPEDYDLMADLPVAAPSPLEALRGQTMTLPHMVRPETVAERVLRTPITLHSTRFGDVVKRIKAEKDLPHDQGLSR